MKKSILVLLLILPVIAFAQKIKSVEVDKFTKKTKIETDNVLIDLSVFGMHSMAVRFRSVDKSSYIIFSGSNVGLDIVGDGDEAIVLLDNDSTFKIYSTGIQSYEYHSGTSIGTSRTPDSKGYSHQYSIGLDDIKLLSEHYVKSIRFYNSDHYSDVEIKKNRAANFFKLCLVFYKQVYTN